MVLLSFYLSMVSTLQSSYLFMVLGPDQEGSGVAGGGLARKWGDGRWKGVTIVDLVFSFRIFLLFLNIFF